MSIKAPQADLNQGSQRTHQVSGKSDTGTGATQATGTSTVSADTLTLTATAAELLKLEESLAAIPDIDSDHIAAIKAAIAEGSYRIDPEKIVDRLLNIEKDIP